VTSTRPPTTLAESIFGGLMSREAMASKATPQGRIDQLNLSDDDCIQKLAALIELRESGDLGEIAKLIGRLAVPLE
jgi:hypothetical protein